MIVIKLTAKYPVEGCEHEAGFVVIPDTWNADAIRDTLEGIDLTTEEMVTL